MLVDLSPITRNVDNKTVKYLPIKKVIVTIRHHPRNGGVQFKKINLTNMPTSWSFFSELLPVAIVPYYITMARGQLPYPRALTCMHLYLKMHLVFENKCMHLYSDIIFFF